MDIQTFLDEFGVFVNAPGGIEVLKKIILQFAISGKLLCVNKFQNKSKVLKEIKKAKKLKSEYITKLHLKKIKYKISSNLNKTPFEIPTYWTWVRLDNLACYIQRGKGPKYTNFSSAHVVSQKCIQWTGFNLLPARYIEEDALKKYGEERFLTKGDILLNSTGTGTVGRVAIYNEDENVKAVADSHVTVIRLSNLSSRYIWCVLASPFIQDRIQLNHEAPLVSGSTKQVEFSTTTVKNLLIPCPPIEEQKRIVTKVDELMSLCDKLESLQKKRERLCKLTRTSALDALANAQNSDVLRNAWDRVQGNMHLLFDKPESLFELQNLIFTLASNNKLASCYLNDCSVLSLLKEINDIQKKEFSKREQKELTALPKPVLIDKKHIQVSIGHICQLISGQHLKPDEYNKNRVGIYYLTGPAEFGEKNPKPEKWTLLKKAIAKKKDVLLTVKGSGIGKVNICNFDELAISRQLVAVRALGKVNTDYLWICLKAAKDFFLDQKMGIAIPGIGRKDVLLLKVVLPCSEEQATIVYIVKKLISYCNTLEIQLRKAQKITNLLINELTESIFNIQTEETKIMKHPQTELISILKLAKTPKKKDHAPLSTILLKHKGELSAKALWHNTGMEIDEFYQQLKNEMAKGWIVEPEKAYMKVLEEPDAS
jgi:type I restriction enzyme S subunit